MKHNLFISLALCFLTIGMLVQPCSAENIASGKHGDNLTWVLDDTGLLTISGVGPMEETVPQPSWILYGSSVRSVVISEGVTSIAPNAFSSTIFNIFSNLQSVVLPTTITSIGYGAFFNCKALTSINIPSSVTLIEYDTFDGCTALMSVYIPSSVTFIEGTAFWRVPNIIYGGDAITVWVGDPKCVNGYVEGFLVFTDSTKTTLAACSSAATGNIVIPNTVTTIEYHAFEGCTALTSVILPDNDIYIEDGTFMDVYNVVYNGNAEGAPWGAKCLNGYIEEPFVFLDSTKTTLVACLPSATSEITIPDTVTTIYTSAFYKCTPLTSVVLPDNDIYIEDGTFMDVYNVVYNGNAEGAPWGAKCLNGYIEEPFVFLDSTKTTLVACLPSVTGEIIIPGTVTAIKQQAFEGFYEHSSVIIPNGVSIIEEETFTWCYGLTSLSIGSGVSNIEEGAIGLCPFLSSVTVDENNSVYDSRNNCNAIIETDSNKLIFGCLGTVIPQDVTSIGPRAFSNCLISSIVIPDNITSIGHEAFSFCDNMASLTLGNGLLSIGENAFGGCNALTTVFAYMDTPIDIENCGFNTFTPIDCYVKEASLSLYQQAEVWKDFNLHGVPLFNVSFVDWDGSILSSQSILQGDKAIAPQPPVRDGYDFSGWDTDFKNIQSDLIITAQYIPQKPSFIENVPLQQSAVKRLSSDGKIYIVLPDGTFYSITGTKISRP